MAEVLGILTTPAGTVSAVGSLKDAGFGDLEVYSPVQSSEIEQAMGRGPSWVRLWTLIGGLFGVTLGYLMTIWMSYDWPLMIGGKPFASIPAYTIIAFELTILFGGILTVIGMIIHGLARVHKKHAVYQPSFSDNEFGCLVCCHVDHIPRVRELLEEAGCTEVRVVEG